MGRGVPVMAGDSSGAGRRLAALLWVTVAAAILASCSPARTPVPAPAPSGPPEVEAAAALGHARELARELGARAPGSQEEQAASVYVTAHLQQAGYAVFLDGVPVEDLVRSTNVVARPPAGGAPEVVVVAPYGTPPEESDGGAAAGLVLELARALRVRSPEHAAGFALLGAEHAAAGPLGSRRLAEDLAEDAPGALVVVVGDVESDAGCLAAGGAEGLVGRLTPTCPETPTGVADASRRVFAAAGLETAAVSGDLDRVATALLRLVEGTEA
jgi:hypothetical protein